jgi:hypothetical protein
MINLLNQQLEHNFGFADIQSWEVWFMTPFGVTPNLKEANEKCIAKDLEPDLVVTPVAVAIGNNGHYEIFFPRR